MTFQLDHFSTHDTMASLQRPQRAKSTGTVVWNEKAKTVTVFRLCRRVILCSFLCSVNRSFSTAIMYIFLVRRVEGGVGGVVPWS